MPVVRATTTVTVNAVSVAVLFTRSCNSLNHGLLDPTEGVAVTTPPVSPLVTVNATVVVRVVEPDTAVIVTVAAPIVAVPEAVKVTVDEFPVVDAGLNDAVTPLGNPLALNATDPGKFVRLIEIVALPVAPRATDSGPDEATV
jgi:predicted cation transporter